MSFGRLLGACAASMALVGYVAAHGGAHQKPLQVDPQADWATRHMAEEHHIGNFDPGAFFSLHDFDDNGSWDTAEILKFYGMEDETAKDVTQEKKDEIVREVLKLVDSNGNGVIEREEWMNFSRGEGGKEKGALPDFGTGPGHHWDMEMEYEIHHWEKYHDENTKEEDLTHPEDIEHFRKHDELEDAAEAQEKLDKQAIVEHNIPSKFRKE
ncbi:hypothetical protein G7Y89_g7786 [Cudoniella acicularis]|uniref:EF-hand domain-containing protein n=1 Tax=Cudoniella acicularis TaxID=354080 RepID=A0A8H4RKA3_9HELO|nr:hypothetical protein G7Y89_g7786 [Cudoniella acicularis]